MRSERISTPVRAPGPVPVSKYRTTGESISVASGYAESRNWTENRGQCIRPFPTDGAPTFASDPAQTKPGEAPDRGRPLFFPPPRPRSGGLSPRPGRSAEAGRGTRKKTADAPRCARGRDATPRIWDGACQSTLADACDPVKRPHGRREKYPARTHGSRFFVRRRVRPLSYTTSPVARDRPCRKLTAPVLGLTCAKERKKARFTISCRKLSISDSPEKHRKALPRNNPRERST